MSSDYANIFDRKVSIRINKNFESVGDDVLKVEKDHKGRLVVIENVKVSKEIDREQFNGGYLFEDFFFDNLGKGKDVCLDKFLEFANIQKDEKIIIRKLYIQDNIESNHGCDFSIELETESKMVSLKKDNKVTKHPQFSSFQKHIVGTDESRIEKYNKLKTEIEALVREYDKSYDDYLTDGMELYNCLFKNGKNKTLKDKIKTKIQNYFFEFLVGTSKEQKVKMLEFLIGSVPFYKITKINNGYVFEDFSKIKEIINSNVKQIELNDSRKIVISLDNDITLIIRFKESRSKKIGSLFKHEVSMIHNSPLIKKVVIKKEFI